MDPYLERHWRDVHASLVVGAKAQLNRLLPDDLVARVEERVVIDPHTDQRGRAIFPDVRVTEDPNALLPGTTPTAGVAVAEPIILELEVEPHTEKFVTIIDAGDGRLVTTIEFLSPTNKLPGAGRDDYQRKRGELRSARVNVVEVDLIRTGRWRDLLRPVVAPREVESPYRVVCWREHPVSRVELFPIAMRQRLPIIPIPLRDGDSDSRLDLQTLVAEVYSEGRYNRLPYHEPLDPPLATEDADWAATLLKADGRA